ncbi:MAG: ABC transporter permease [Methylococcales bacterium]|jgi:phospholipid/cholesterol/gamma-HCH transport system permease protein|nr:MAG: ABC transporter permease [Methylococcales bacterium]
MAVDNRPSNITVNCKAHLLEVDIIGDWLLDSQIPDLDLILAQFGDGTQFKKLVFSTESLGRWDSLLMTELIKLISYSEEKGISVDTKTLPSGIQGLLGLVFAVPERAGVRRQSIHISWLEIVGNSGLRLQSDVNALIVFIGNLTLSVFAFFRGKAHFRWVDLWRNVQDCGPSALPIITLISLLVGLILAFVGSVQLSLFGAQLYIADLVGLGMSREMGGLMTAVIMSGRTGAAYAAQLGTMQVNNEIDALETMGFDPMEFLVLPRVLALIFVMPLLCLYADLMGIIGGALVTVNFFEVSLVEYINRTINAIHMLDLSVGVFKCAVFGVLIALSGCMRGMQCGRSASEVGDATTSAVVTGIVFIVIADSLMTIICNRLGI